MTTFQHQPAFVHAFVDPATAVPDTPVPNGNSTPTRPRLRSCLSPTRSPSVTPSASSAVNTPSGSRSTSFSSCTSGTSWKRGKSVRWQEMNGCAVTAQHYTYSQEEYDRTPLEPPTIAERACVLPERGSRCLSISRDCFSSTSDSHSSSLYIDGEGEEDSDDQDTSADSYYLHTPPPSETNSDDDGGDHQENEKEEKRQWEECMERRRLMFARMCPQQANDERHPEFEGYRSISATLANLLKSVNSCEEVTEEDEEDCSVAEEDDDEENEIVRDCGFGFSSSTSKFDPLKIGERQEEEEEEEEREPDTPSLVSSAEESELDCIISSPGGNSTALIHQKQQQQQQQQRRNIIGVCTEEIVLAAWTSKQANREKSEIQQINERGRDRTTRTI
ncbi:uncharacterized protein IL334_002761 [Kwoniella shivajii]|uniref:Uncharacterized protein n=1 Tax=Kwoniella shivajii TaxID=564305 RepID=A0ABZ1CVM5_9TREE|nr:hypothetical protein IL334_002761 [Kwoniella shivajii]